MPIRMYMCTYIYTQVNTKTYLHTYLDLSILCEKQVENPVRKNNKNKRFLQTYRDLSISCAQFSYAGFEQQPKKFTDPLICLLNVELELKSEKENAEIRLDDPDQYRKCM